MIRKKKFYFIATLAGILIVTGGCGQKPLTVADLSNVDQMALTSESGGTFLEKDQNSESENILMPTSLCAMDKVSNSIICYATTGKISAEFQAPGIDSSDPTRIQIIENLADSTQSPMVVYHAWKPDQALLYSENGNVRAIKETGTFLAVAGGPASPVIAYSEAAYANGISYSRMFAGIPKSLVEAEPFFDLEDKTTSLALLPVSVESTGEKVKKVWFTQTTWVMGGEDLVYPFNRGLNVFDFATGQIIQILDYSRNFKGLSPDHSLAGSMDFNLAGNQSVKIDNLLTGGQVYFSLDSASDRGAGNVVFNYDGKLAAWQEASGSRVVEPSTFETRIQLGEISKGEIIHDIQTGELEAVLGWQAVSYINSVGWFNNHLLVIEVRGSSRDAAALVLFDTKTGKLTKFCEGSFVGFLYQ